MTVEHRPSGRASHRNLLLASLVAGTYAAAPADGAATGPDHPSAWSSKAKRVVGGEVSWRVLSRHTPGLPITVRAPWEPELGYPTTVAMRPGRGASPSDGPDRRSPGVAGRPG